MKLNQVSNKRREQLDEMLNKLRKLPPPPKKGWVSEIRNALHMSSAQLARRLKVAQSVVANYERSEQQRRISLATLDKIANALGCEVHYALVPKQTLTKTLLTQAKKVLAKHDSEIERTMRLEGQGSFENKLDSALDAALLVVNKGKRLWDD